jgi:transcriptional regulator with XRE-family HTH domain
MGESIKSLFEELKRKHNGKFSQEKLAAEICVKQGTLSKYMNDDAPLPFSTAIYISKKYKKPEFMFEWLKQLNELAFRELIPV